MNFKRIFVVVMELSVGIGEAPDAEHFGDKGADTLGHIAERMNGLYMPNMAKLGLSNIREIEGVEKARSTTRFLYKNARSINWKRHNDWTLGNHGS